MARFEPGEREGSSSNLARFEPGEREGFYGLAGHFPIPSLPPTLPPFPQAYLASCLVMLGASVCSLSPSFPFLLVTRALAVTSNSNR